MINKLKNLFKNKKHKEDTLNPHTELSMADSGYVIINGIKYDAPQGSAISVCDDGVYINGILQHKANKKISSVEVNIQGNVNNIDCTGSVYVSGDCGSNVCCGGSIDIGGDVNGDVDAGGSVNISGSTGGDVDAGGSVLVHGSVIGDVNAGGSVTVNKE